MSDPIPLNYRSKNGKTPSPGADKPLRDDLAYIIPMAVFMVFVWLGGKGDDTGHGNTWYPWTYIARAVVVGVLLIAFRRAYTKIRWNHWWLGLIVGIAGFFQWVGMQLFLQNHFPFFKPADGAFNPDLFFADSGARWGFIAVRLLGASLVVPFMEELFWRDFAWRSIIAPNDFKLAGVGDWDPKAFLVVPLIFAVVHGNWWATAIVWAFLVGALLAYTKSLGACIIAHATTNLMLGLYVLYSKQWFFW
jgi:CAAX prenyl protease-like protein